jgi:ferredoxin
MEVGTGLPSLKPEACTGCRLCEASCPTGALGDAEELVRAIQELGNRPNPVLGCRVPGVEAHGRIACLGLLDVEALLALTAHFPDGLTLNLVQCSACRNAEVVPVLRRSLEALAALPGHPASRLRLADSRRALAFAGDSLSRREFFSMFRRKSATAAGTALARLQPSAPEPYSAKRLPAGRRALLRMMPHLPPALRSAAEVKFFPAVEFSPACRKCTGCAGVCPTGALTTDSGDPPRPVFERSACTACQVCVEFCRRGAPVLSTSAAPRQAP